MISSIGGHYGVSSQNTDTPHGQVRLAWAQENHLCKAGIGPLPDTGLNTTGIDFNSLPSVGPKFPLRTVNS